MDANLTEFADRMRALAPIDIIDHGGIPIASVPEGRSLKSIKPLLDEYLTKPERKKGTAIALNAASFIDLANREKLPASAIFADNRVGHLKLVGVLNYQEPAAGDAAFGDHRVVYHFPLSREWNAWHKGNGIRMGQAEFAEFLEDHILDVIEPPDVSRDTGDVDAMIELQRKLGGTFAGSARLLELSRGMAVNVDSTVKNVVNLSSGEQQVQFEETHKDGAGAPLKVPSLFLIGIPVFEDGALYRLAVRLRYRKDLAALKWFYEIYRADKALDDAFDEVCQDAAAKTSLPLYIGTPEA